MRQHNSEFWKYAAIALASLLFATNAAHFYTGRVLKAELASYKVANTSAGSSTSDVIEETDNTMAQDVEFNADADFAAAAVFYTTLLSMLSVTVLIALLR